MFTKTEQFLKSIAGWQGYMVHNDPAHIVEAKAALTADLINIRTEFQLKFIELTFQHEESGYITAMKFGPYDRMDDILNIDRDQIRDVAQFFQDGETIGVGGSKDLPVRA